MIYCFLYCHRPDEFVVTVCNYPAHFLCVMLFFNSILSGSSDTIPTNSPELNPDIVEAGTAVSVCVNRLIEVSFRLMKRLGSYLGEIFTLRFLIFPSSIKKILLTKINRSIKSYKNYSNINAFCLCNIRMGNFQQTENKY